MPKKTAKAKAKAKAEPKAPERRGIAVQFAQGAGQKNGTPNCLKHGRYAQGGVIDAMLAHSVLTGKGITPELVNKQIDADNAERPPELQKPHVTSSRMVSHIKHLLYDVPHCNSLPFDVTIDGAEYFAYSREGGLTPEQIKALANSLTVIAE